MMSLLGGFILVDCNRYLHLDCGKQIVEIHGVEN